MSGLSKLSKILMCCMGGMLLLADCTGKRVTQRPIAVSLRPADSTPSVAHAPMYAAQWTDVFAQARLVGRFELDDAHHLRFGWPNTRLGARFSGTSLQADMGEVQPNAIGEGPAHNVFDVFVDNQPPHALVLQPDVHTYTLAEGLDPGEHEVWLSKRTEGMVGSIYFKAFIPEEGGALLTPPPARARRIQFIGASNETGYGNMQHVLPARMCRFSADTENADMAYPNLVADRLDADLTNLSFTGKGIYQNAVPEVDHETVPALAERADPLDAGSRWQYLEPAPHVVVCDLGGNDFIPSTPNEQHFVDAYSHFLWRLRHRYPHAEVFVVVSPMVMGPERTDLNEYLTSVMDRMGDAHMHMFEFKEYRGQAYGCDYHPTAELHQAMADAIAPVIRNTMGW